MPSRRAGRVFGHVRDRFGHHEVGSRLDLEVLPARRSRNQGAQPIPRARARSESLGHRQQHGGVFDGLQRVPRVGNGHEVAGCPVRSLVSGDEGHVTVEDLQGGLTRALMLVEAGPGS